MDPLPALGGGGDAGGLAGGDVDFVEGVGGGGGGCGSGGGEEFSCGAEGEAGVEAAVGGAVHEADDDGGGGGFDAFVGVDAQEVGGVGAGVGGK